VDTPTVAELVALVDVLQQEITLLRLENEQLRAEKERLWSRVTVLEAQIGTTSKNSWKPPSSVTG